MRLAAIVMLTISAAAFAQDVPQWVLSLAKLKRQMRAELQRQPNFLCTQTVDRYQRAPNAGSFQFLDAMRLQVAVVDGQEMMANGLEGKLDVADAGRFAKSGAFGTGAFSSTARNLFMHDTGRTTAWGEETVNGRKALRFDFDIPERMSGFVVSSGDFRARVGERGSYWADATTLDLLRLITHAVDIPAALGMKEVTTDIEYRRTRLGKVDVLLPKRAETLIVSFNGWQKKNVLNFPDCREYSTESTIRFDTEK
jgi:hypothetical protein